MRKHAKTIQMSTSALSRKKTKVAQSSLLVKNIDIRFARLNFCLRGFLFLCQNIAVYHYLNIMIWICRPRFAKILRALFKFPAWGTMPQNVRIPGQLTAFHKLASRCPPFSRSASVTTSCFHARLCICPRWKMTCGKK